MKLQTMRRIDYWAGIPLCWLCSLVDKLWRTFIPPKLGPPRRVLFIELSEMGSAILAHSMIAHTIDRYQATPYFLIFKKNRPSVDLLGVVPREQVLTVDDSSLVRFLWSLGLTMLRLWRLRLDTVVDLELFSRCTALISFLSGARQRSGFFRFTLEGLYRGSFFTHAVFYNPQQHITLNFLSLVLAFEGDRTDPPLTKQDPRPALRALPTWEPSSQQRTKMRTLIAGVPTSSALVLLNPDPGLLELRGWPKKSWVALARQLIQRYPSLTLGVIGLPRTRVFAEAIQAAVGKERCLDLSGQTDSIEEVVTLCTLATLLLTIDSGPAHFAALTKIRSVVLFGPETPALYSPHSPNAISLSAGLACSPCYAAANHRDTVCTNNVCMQALTVERVFAAAADQLRAAGVPS